MTALLRPFYYEFPKIFSLPFEQLRILNSPVPLVCGLNMKKKDYIKLVEKGKKFKKNDDTILVFLDFENFKFEYSMKIKKEFVSPRMKEFKQKVKKAYDEFGESFKNFNDKSDFVWSQDYKIGLTMAILLKNGLTEMLKKIPDEPVYKDDELIKVKGVFILFLDV